MARRDAGSGLMRRPYGRGGGGGGRSPYLLDYRDATFSRASEAAAVDPRNGWAFYDLSTPWLGSNVPRILPDGSILIEGARTNLWQRSEELDSSPWNAGGTNANITADQVAAPDGVTDADRVNFNDTTINPQWRQSVAAASFGDNVLVQWSTYCRALSGTEDIRFFSWAKDGSTITNTPVTMGAEWARYVHSFDSLTGSIAVLGGVRQPDPSGATRQFYVWGAQGEIGAFPSSPIRTAGATATRAVDLCTMAAGTIDPRLFTRGFEVDLWQIPEPGDGVTSLDRIFEAVSGAGNGLYWRNNGANMRLVVNGTTYHCAAFTGTPAKITCRVDFIGGTWTVYEDGVPQTPIAIAGDWGAVSAVDMRVGNGAFGSTPANAVISRPRAV